MQLHGRCCALFVFDVAREIHLDRAERRLSPAPRAPFRHKQHQPPDVSGQVVPLRVIAAEPPLVVARRATAPSVEVSLYGFGALCATWSLPVEADLEELVELAGELYGNAELLERSRGIARDVLAALGDAAERPNLAPSVEDYVIWELEADDAAGLEESERHALARLLRAEREPLAPEEIEGALAIRTAYAPGEACYVDWNAALLIGRDMADEHLVLELATVELLELRYLEGQLARGVDRAFEILSQPRWRALSPRSRELQHIALLQADDAVLHEGIDNALKLLGDDYLARLYRLATQRFHFDEWDALIERKLEVLDSIYGKLADLAARRRAEVLEWIIIVLIAADIAVALYPSS